MDKTDTKPHEWRPISFGVDELTVYMCGKDWPVTDRQRTCGGQLCNCQWLTWLGRQTEWLTGGKVRPLIWVVTHSGEAERVRGVTGMFKAALFQNRQWRNLKLQFWFVSVLLKKSAVATPILITVTTLIQAFSNDVLTEVWSFMTEQPTNSKVGLADLFLLTFSFCLTFPWPLGNCLTFPDFPGGWSTCMHYVICSLQATSTIIITITILATDPCYPRWKTPFSAEDTMTLKRSWHVNSTINSVHADHIWVYWIWILSQCRENNRLPWMAIHQNTVIIST